MAFGKRETVFANGALILQILPHILGKFLRQSLRQKVGKIPRQILFAKLCAPATFHLANKSLVKSILASILFSSIVICKNKRRHLFRSSLRLAELHPFSPSIVAYNNHNNSSHNNHINNKHISNNQKSLFSISFKAKKHSDN